MSGENEEVEALEEGLPEVADYALLRGRYVDESGKVHLPGEILELPVDYAEGRDRWERVD